MSKLRAHDTLGFRPQNPAQEKLIHDAQKATGIKMADLLRRAVLLGLPRVVEQVREQQERAFELFDEQMRNAENTDSPKPSGVVSYLTGKPKRKT